jgi:hypothetical protein
MTASKLRNEIFLIGQWVGDRISACNERQMKVPGLTGNLHKITKRFAYNLN